MFWIFDCVFLRKFALKIPDSTGPCCGHCTCTKYGAGQWILLVRRVACDTYLPKPKKWDRFSGHLRKHEWKTCIIFILEKAYLKDTQDLLPNMFSHEWMPYDDVIQLNVPSQRTSLGTWYHMKSRELVVSSSGTSSRPFVQGILAWYQNIFGEGSEFGEVIVISWYPI